MKLSKELFNKIKNYFYWNNELIESAEDNNIGELIDHIVSEINNNLIEVTNNLDEANEILAEIMSEKYNNDNKYNSHITVGEVS